MAKFGFYLLMDFLALLRRFSVRPGFYGGGAAWARCRGVLEGRIEEAVPALDADVVLYCAGGFAAWTKAGRPVTR
jgi:hypothetical protein